MLGLNEDCLHDEQAAYEVVERALWTDGVRCAHCGGTRRITKVRANPEKRVRLGLWRCGNCKRQFTVKIGTVLEASNVRLQLWLQAVVLITAGRKPVNAHQLHRILGVTYKTARMMETRISAATGREAAFRSEEPQAGVGLPA